MRNLLAAIANDAFVKALVVLLKVLDTEDGAVGGCVSPPLEAAALHGEVFEALKLDGTLRILSHLHHCQFAP